MPVVGKHVRCCAGCSSHRCASGGSGSVAAAVVLFLQQRRECGYSGGAALGQRRRIARDAYTYEMESNGWYWRCATKWSTF